MERIEKYFGIVFYIIIFIPSVSYNANVFLKTSVLIFSLTQDYWSLQFAYVSNLQNFDLG